MNTKSEELYNKVVKVITLICETRNIDNDYVPKEFIEDTIPCPCCNNGVVHYTISEYNGHRSAKCSNDCFGQYCE